MSGVLLMCCFTLCQTQQHYQIKFDMTKFGGGRRVHPLSLGQKKTVNNNSAGGALASAKVSPAPPDIEAGSPLVPRSPTGGCREDRENVDADLGNDIDIFTGKQQMHSYPVGKAIVDDSTTHISDATKRHRLSSGATELITRSRLESDRSSSADSSGSGHAGWLSPREPVPVMSRNAQPALSRLVSNVSGEEFPAAAVVAGDNDDAFDDLIYNINLDNSNAEPNQMHSYHDAKAILDDSTTHIADATKRHRLSSGATELITRSRLESDRSSSADSGGSGHAGWLSPREPVPVIPHIARSDGEDVNAQPALSPLVSTVSGEEFPATAHDAAFDDLIYNINLDEDIDETDELDEHLQGKPIELSSSLAAAQAAKFTISSDEEETEDEEDSDSDSDSDSSGSGDSEDEEDDSDSDSEATTSPSSAII
jgi:hypothetical protein